MIDVIYSFLLGIGFLMVSGRLDSRLLRWTGLLVVVFCVHLLHVGEPPFLRMVMICSTLLIGMKGIVLADWGGKLTRARWFIFCFLWFGMEPTPFAAAKRKLSWKKDAGVALGCFVFGMLLSVAVAQLSGAAVLIMFVPLSLAFHYGVLGLLAAFWRMRGIAVRSLFRNPLMSEGLGDFWSKRWNLSFSQMMARSVQRPLTKLLGKKGALFGVFLVSGLLHELAITLPVQSGYGMPTLYFVAHGLAVLLERNIWPRWMRFSLAMLLVAGPLPLLFPAEFTEEVIVFTLNHLTINP